jgi:hypothetical protein
MVSSFFCSLVPALFASPIRLWTRRFARLDVPPPVAERASDGANDLSDGASLLLSSIAAAFRYESLGNRGRLVATFRVKRVWCLLIFSHRLHCDVKLYVPFCTTIHDRRRAAPEASSVYLTAPQCGQIDGCTGAFEAAPGRRSRPHQSPLQEDPLPKPVLGMRQA